MTVFPTVSVAFHLILLPVPRGSLLTFITAVGPRAVVHLVQRARLTVRALAGTHTQNTQETCEEKALGRERDRETERQRERDRERVRERQRERERETKIEWQ